MGVGHLAAQLFQPGGPRQHHVGEAPRCLVHEQVVGDHEIGTAEALGQPPGIGERREHIGAEQEHGADTAVEQAVDHLRHLVGNVGARADVRSWARCSPMPGRGWRCRGAGQASTGDAKVAAEGREAGDGTTPLPTVAPLCIELPRYRSGIWVCDPFASDQI